MIKKKILSLVLAIVIVTCPMVAFARSYDYNIYSTGLDNGYTTSQAYRGCGSYTNEYATNVLTTNTSTKPIYFQVCYVDGWVAATSYRWQSSGTTYYYDYYSPSFTDKTGYYKLYMRRDTDDTYSGTRHVVGSWYVE